MLAAEEPTPSPRDIKCLLPSGTNGRWCFRPPGPSLLRACCTNMSPACVRSTASAAQETTRGAEFSCRGARPQADEKVMRNGTLAPCQCCGSGGYWFNHQSWIFHVKKSLPLVGPQPST